ncbi:substrate-binding periplasmic protein [Simkania negevensis]|uniref:Amino acid ABC transporter, periplasmic amino acid-binding protein n=1 Tax=Simkania negevensis (strain ATCC VR-1471 / DSM 27360 / Z) TaxID=331113 RepID=F8L623_SIMNZ|nr:transporter substrate-binding domain-containing protein [Simkania negevensis]CCB88177.1 amino acid ABC transporter, periplasmic amino acid-binding protein [Simkania negevensis Z]
MVYRFFLLIILSLAFVGCGSKGKTYTVGVDPTWFPLNLMGKELNVFAFSNELLLEISRHEGINFQRLNLSWDNLTMGLEEGKCDAILSSVYPYVFELKKYDFSDLYLNTGPVLLVKGDSMLNVSSPMEGKEIAVGSQEQEALFIRLYPQAIVRYYNQIPTALNALVNGYVDGVVVGYIPATAFVEDLYEGKLKIATPPLNEAGLRLLTVHDEHSELIEAFNRGLEKTRDSGKYEKLLKKWNLD